MTEGRRPLDGVRVLDLSRVLAGPVCCQLLAELGADVVKVERPGRGDDTREWGPPFIPGGGPSAYFASANHGKRSLALDLSAAAGAEVLRDLLRAADIMVENFLPDAVEKFGLRPPELQALNPRLVSCSISGYGRTGPMAGVPGYDLVIQATSGLMGITGEPDGAPMKIGVAMSDVIAGLYAAVSALAGLRARDAGQSGMAFDLALMDCTLTSLVNVAQSTLVTGQRPARFGNAHPQIVPYEVFPTSDGHLVLAIGNDAQWQRFCATAGLSELAADERFQTNPARVEHRAVLVARLRDVLAQHGTAAWLTLLAESGLPHCAVTTLDEAFQQPQTLARDLIQTVTDGAGRTYRVLGSPVHWFGEGVRTVNAPPLLGEHTDEVLSAWASYDAARIARLRNERVIA